MTPKEIICPNCEEHIKFLKVVKANGEIGVEDKDIYICPLCENQVADSKEDADIFLGVE